MLDKRTSDKINEMQAYFQTGLWKPKFNINDLVYIPEKERFGIITGISYLIDDESATFTETVKIQKHKVNARSFHWIYQVSKFSFGYETLEINNQYNEFWSEGSLLSKQETIEIAEQQLAALKE